MGKSVRSKSEKRKRTIKRQKIENWERLNCEKLSKSIVASLESADNVVMHADGAPLTEEQKQNIAEKLKLNESSMEVEEKPKSLNKIMKSGTPKRKKAKSGKFGQGYKKRKA